MCQLLINQYQLNKGFQILITLIDITKQLKIKQNILLVEIVLDPKINLCLFMSFPKKS